MSGAEPTSRGQTDEDLTGELDLLHRENASLKRQNAHLRELVAHLKTGGRFGSKPK